MSFDCLLKHYKIRKDVPIKSLTKKEREIILYGSPEPISCSITSKSGNTFNKHGIVEGVLSLIKRRHLETGSEDSRAYYSKYISMKQCAHCHGNKLNEAALSVKINGKNITEITSLTIQNAINFFLNIKLTATEKQIAELVLKEILDRLSFLNDVGLNYLSLERSANTLSGGEAQRIRLATQIGSNLTGVLYVLDEPSIGLHQKDNSMLIKSLKKMRDIGNSIVVVEHDLETIEESDYVIEVGPNAGIYGGTITAAGTPKEIAANKKSITGQYLSGTTSIPIPKTRRSGNGKRIIIKGIKTNNLKNIDVTIPMGKMIAITGVSGSGKSTLINEVLIPNIQKRLFDPFISAPEVKSIVGIAEVDKIISVTQQPIGQTPRSNPATYVGVFDDIRELYTQIPEAKSRGYTKSRFSFNVPGGRCEKCNGDGVIRIEMLFLPNVHIVCDECDGKKYNEDTLQIKYRGKSISDVLEMNVVEALEFFDKVPNIHHKLSLLNDVGLGYIKLGMSADKLSGGEAQRIKLAKFLQKRTSPNTILVLDEPTTGLHLDDIKKLILILDRIANSGATVIIIEHNLDLIKCVDHIIDLGPDGGEGGGEIIVSGTPEQICENKDSYTAQYLKKILQNKSLKFKK
jgi:excinuclease ABC subunit A